MNFKHGAEVNYVSYRLRKKECVLQVEVPDGQALLASWMFCCWWISSFLLFFVLHPYLPPFLFLLLLYKTRVILLIIYLRNKMKE